MKMEDMVLVSVDDHVIEPANLFDDFLPAKYLDRAPKLISDDIGEKWVFGEGETRNVGLNAVAGRVPEEYGLEPTNFDEIRVGLLRCRRADQGHERQRGARLFEFSVNAPFLRSVLRLTRGRRIPSWRWPCCRRTTTGTSTPGAAPIPSGSSLARSRRCGTPN